MYRIFKGWASGHPGTKRLRSNLPFWGILCSLVPRNIWRFVLRTLSKLAKSSQNLGIGCRYNRAEIFGGTSSLRRSNKSDYAKRVAICWSSSLATRKPKRTWTKAEVELLNVGHDDCQSLIDWSHQRSLTMYAIRIQHCEDEGWSQLSQHRLLWQKLMFLRSRLRLRHTWVRRLSISVWSPRTKNRPLICVCLLLIILIQILYKVQVSSISRKVGLFLDRFARESVMKYKVV